VAVLLDEDHFTLVGDGDDVAPVGAVELEKDVLPAGKGRTLPALRELEDGIGAEYFGGEGLPGRDFDGHGGILPSLFQYSGFEERWRHPNRR